MILLRRMILPCVVLLVGLFVSSEAFSQETTASAEVATGQQTATSEEDQKAIDEVGEALRSQWEASWYDKKNDELRPVRLRTQQKVSKKQPDSFWSSFMSWLESFNNIYSIFKFLGWLLLFATIAALIYFLIQTMQSKRLDSLSSEDEAIRRGPQRAERIEELPVALTNAEGDLLDQADRLRRNGDLAGAIVRLFSYQLLELDHADYLRLVKGKTNRLYLRELRRRAPDKPELASILLDTMQLFEETYFGGRVPTPKAFESCWQASKRFQLLISQTESQAA